MSLGAGKARTADTSAFPAHPAAWRILAGSGGFDKLGLVMAIVTAAALTLPFANFRPNRIAAARGVELLGALPAGIGWPSLLLFILAAATVLRRNGPLFRLLLAGAALIVLGVLIGLVPAALMPPGKALARVAPAAGFWLLAFSFAIILTDAAAKLALGPVRRLLALAVAAAVFAAFLISGHWNGLSVMKEYATYSDGFAGNALRHVELALGSLAGALVIGLPLGIACHRSQKLRGIVLPVLNIIQTVPSIAMYGLMMAPLALLAANYPLLRDLGIRGIGAAPAVIALFLYSLLPVVSNTAAGLASVPPAAVDAAAGMGMTRRQRLFQVELPLALPVILTGVRIVLVQNIGLVTIAALIGGGGFGFYVFNGIGQQAIDLVLLGTVPTIALAFTAAIILDAAVDLLKGQRS
ncbi:osmoprotectant transport system permease protein [Labrys monachus]|uniref:Osmoprotectant transport system permease protein n=2 Tax=Labrys monachus TaxID=217067 RepID=A0ABU0FHX4_9HYPH|nr:osmoprotectant transport system permease protein [Labrys monachus]